MENFFDAPVIISAVIAGSITLVTMLINMFLSLSKHKYDEITNYQKSVIDKLEKIYNPLVIRTNHNSKRKFLIDEKISTLLDQFGYLLSDELFRDFSTLQGIESLDDLQHLRVNIGTNKKEKDNLKRKIVDQLNREYKELKSYYENSFTNYTKKLSKPIYIVILEKFGLLCIMITIIFYLFVLGGILFGDIFSEETVFGNPLIDTLFIIFVIIIMLTTVFGLSYLVGKFVDKIALRMGKKKKMFVPNDFVPDTANYYCRVCKKVVKKYKYDTFDSCKDHTLRQNLILILLYFKWKLDETKDGL